MRALSAAPLGADFWKLWTSSAVTNLGDGITMVAGPLLVASITSNPAAVAGAVFAQQLPWLLFALVSGAWADRLDRRRLVVTVNLMRVAALTVLAVAVAAGLASVPLILAVFFLLGTGETLADTASAAFVPAIVPEPLRPRANSLMYANVNVLNQFAAKPLGGWLFVVAGAVPFAVNAVTFAVSAALISMIRAVSPRSSAVPAAGLGSGVPAAGPGSGSPADGSGSGVPAAGPGSGSPADGSGSGVPAAGLGSGVSDAGLGSGVSDAGPGSGAPDGVGPADDAVLGRAVSAGVDGDARPGLRAEIADGVRWLMRHRLLRSLAFTMAAGNVVFCAAFAVFVLYAEQRLGLTEVGYGVLLVAFAVGGLLGTLLSPSLIRRVGASVLLRVGLLIEVALHATLASTTSPFTAATMIVVFGIHTTVWGVVVTTLGQRDIPSTMFGRVTSVYSFLELGGAALGSLLGGAVATAYGLVATYWSAAAAMTVVAAMAWRPLRSATLRAPAGTT
ncbi:MFS transporter [Actinoplanes sp. LDG1-06]|uniref:MFS transporter n=1 Tax=Paractinoplanes ovalisporus TaxID=2810368 RepID=A0ABS2AGY8_9ACTN|nr:MFS transporter [Actinoplanes ovalisporus]MBM2619083.1 MFS transporter [Actinoplanes ovalisporus]